MAGSDLVDPHEERVGLLILTDKLVRSWKIVDVLKEEDSTMFRGFPLAVNIYEVDVHVGKLNDHFSVLV